jgi:hypothetical protein
MAKILKYQGGSATNNSDSLMGADVGSVNGV